MASLNVRKKNGSVFTLSGSAYENDVEGTRKLCIRTGTRPNQVDTYGIATVKTATEYAPLAFDANGEIAYIGRKETFYTYSTREKVESEVIEMANTMPNPELTPTRISTKSQPYNYVTSRSTTFEDRGTPEYGFAASIPSGFPNPDEKERDENINGLYHTIYSIKKSQKVYTYKSTVSHTYEEGEKYTQSTNGSGKYKCDATVGSFSYEGVYGDRYYDQNSGGSWGINDHNYMTYYWTVSSEDGKYYYWSEGYHDVWGSNPFGSSSNRPTNYIQYRVNGNGSVGWSDGGEKDGGSSGTTSYKTRGFTWRYWTVYAWDREDYGNCYANITTKWRSAYTRSSAPMTTTKEMNGIVTKTHSSAISGEETWWEPPGTYTPDTKYDSCHGVDNVLRTVTATSLNYATTMHKSTQASVKEGTGIDTTLISDKHDYAEQVNSTLSRTIQFFKKVSYTNSTSSKSFTTINNGEIEREPGTDLIVNATHNFI